MGVSERCLALCTACVMGAGSLLGSSPAEATIDAGYAAHLVAVVGDPASHAVFADVDVGGEGHCAELHLVDLRADAFTRVHSGECPGYEAWQAGLEEGHIREFLPEGFEAVRIRVGPFEEIHRFVFDWREFGLPAPPEGLAHLSVHLRVNSEVPSMATNELHSGERCMSDGEYFCEGCRASERTLDGETFATHVCGAASEECDCTATAKIMRFVVVDEERGRRFLGNRLFISPNRLIQVQIGEQTGQPGMGLVLPDLRALEIDDVIIVWGAAGHAPTANGTWFPVMGAVLTGDEEEEEVTPSSPPRMWPNSPFWWLSPGPLPPER